MYLIWQTKVIDNHDKLKIREYLIFPICFCQRETIYVFFTNLINSKLISELVLSDKSVFLSFNATQVWPNLISITIFFTHAQLQNSVSKA